MSARLRLYANELVLILAMEPLSYVAVNFRGCVDTFWDLFMPPITHVFLIHALGVRNVKCIVCNYSLCRNQI